MTVTLPVAAYLLLSVLAGLVGFTAGLAAAWPRPADEPPAPSPAPPPPPRPGRLPFNDGDTAWSEIMAAFDALDRDVSAQTRPLRKYGG